MAEANPCTAETISSAPWLQYNSYEPDDNCPEGGFYIHNTEVVIDRNGAVIARYYDFVLITYWVAIALKDKSSSFLFECLIFINENGFCHGKKYWC